MPINTATIVSSTRVDGSGHTFIIFKNELEELIIIDAQYNPIIITRGKQAIRAYFDLYTQLRFYFRGKLLDISKIPTLKERIPVRIKTKIKNRSLKKLTKSFFEGKRDSRFNTLNRKRGRGKRRRNKLTRKNKI
jgi:hypothetical protein